MELLCFVLFGILIISVALIILIPFLFIKSENKNGRITGKIIAIIKDGEEAFAEHSLHELIFTAERLRDNGVDLEIYILNRSKDKETGKLLEIFCRRYCCFHVIEDRDEKEGFELLNIDNEVPFDKN